MTPRAPIVVGDTIGGRYRVEELLGHGGMAIVYRARHTGTGKLCALKLIHAHLVTRRQLIDLFVKEAQVGARIGENPHIIDVFDAGEDEARGVPFLAMDLLRGETLEDYVKTHGPMPPDLLRVLFEQLADALDQAHGAGVVHRDLKPSNLFLTYDRKGKPVLKVMDFGIAKVLELEGQRTATQIGTPAYAAPEQMGASLRRIAERHGIVVASGVSPSTDIWALGLMAYELLTGLPTGQFWGVEALTEFPTKVVLEEHEAPSARAGDLGSLLPPGFDAWFARCTRKNAGERWPTAGQAVGELCSLFDPESIAVTQPFSAPLVAVTEPGGPLLAELPVVPPVAKVIVSPSHAPQAVPLPVFAGDKTTPLAPERESAARDEPASLWQNHARILPADVSPSPAPERPQSREKSRRLLVVGLLSASLAVGGMFFAMKVWKTQPIPPISDSASPITVLAPAPIPSVSNTAPNSTTETIDRPIPYVSAKPSSGSGKSVAPRSPSPTPTFKSLFELPQEKSKE